MLQDIVEFLHSSLSQKLDMAGDGRDELRRFSSEPSVRIGVKICDLQKKTWKKLFVVYSYQNIKVRMGARAGRGQFRVTRQDRMWVLSVKAGAAARGSDGKGWSRDVSGGKYASQNCRLNSEFWLKLGLEFDPNPGFKRAEG